MDSVSIIFRQRFSELKGLDSRREVSQKCGIPEHNVSLYASGEKQPDLYTLAAIARGYGVTTDYLLGLTSKREAKWRDPKLCNNSKYSWR